jgi:hypothetical protein
MFISAISILIMQNLKDSESFLKVVNSGLNLTQTQVTIKNINYEIMKFFKDKKEDIDDIIDKIPKNIPFTLKDDIIIQLQIEQFNPENYIFIDDINQSLPPEEFEVNVDYKYRFFEILKKNKKLLSNHKFTNQKQLNNMIQEYITDTSDTRILNIKDKFAYGSFENNESVKYLKCKYKVSVSDIKSVVNMIFEVGKTSPINFEFYFISK